MVRKLLSIWYYYEGFLRNIWLMWKPRLSNKIRDFQRLVLSIRHCTKKPTKQLNPHWNGTFYSAPVRFCRLGDKEIAAQKAESAKAYRCIASIQGTSQKRTMEGRIWKIVNLCQILILMVLCSCVAFVFSIPFCPESIFMYFIRALRMKTLKNDQHSMYLVLSGITLLRSSQTSK